ncbi:hypothetical protein [Paracoccus sp. SY]|uniref:hypothetical protein n=1 Tax=Paracoccus sp. SY TaxID=1330255 RepID=UPI0011AED12D|nr:hypothetical protein [Paracoccus sp. SY]
MSLRKPRDKQNDRQHFAPEADACFDVVAEEKIEAWRTKLNERFGIGQGRLVSLDEHAHA